MKNFIKILLSILILSFITSEALSQVKVKGYYKKNGTYVEPHYRSNPDGNPYNNWSYPGNTNPYTGITATGNEDTYLKNYNNTYNNSNESSSNNSYSSDYYNSSAGLIVYTDLVSTGEILIFVDDKYIGSLDKYFSYGVPTSYGEEGTVSLSLSTGYHNVKAYSTDGNYWNGSVRVLGGTNKVLNLTDENY